MDKIKGGFNLHFIQFFQKVFKSFFYRHERFISKKKFQLFFLKPFLINIVVERVPCCICTSNGLALTLLMFPHYWLLENQSRFTNESRNAMVLKIWFLNLFRSNSRNRALFPSYNEKSVVGWIQPILEINNSHTLPFQRKSIHQALHLDLLDWLLKYQYLTRNSRRTAKNPRKGKDRLHFSYDLLFLIDRLIIYIYIFFFILILLFF